MSSAVPYKIFDAAIPVAVILYLLPAVNSSAKGNDGTGGLLVIYAPTIKNNGLITADGTTGGNPGTQARGGSSGGGSINIFYSKIVI